jgi:ATP phosphoribosyltransferase regulatory subunit
MPAESARQFEALERQAQRLMSVFLEAGYEAVAPAIIQPADVFLDVIGEELRARTYVFADPEGAELCLRPDLTVPTCRIHVARHADPTTIARYCYNGPAFRYQPSGPTEAHPNEFRQAGIELFAEPDAEGAEVEVVRLILAALREAGLKSSTLRIGDLGLFHALIGAVDLPGRSRQRLRGQFWRAEAFRSELTRLTSRPAGSLRGLPAELVTQLDVADRERSAALVARHLEANGIPLIGARSLAEITDGLLAAADDARSEPIAEATARLIEGYLAIAGPAREAEAQIAKLFAGLGPQTESALDHYRRRLDLIDAAGIDTSAIEFSAEFGRNLEYYTGFVFEVVTPELGRLSPLAGGGRYDSLLKAVGAASDIPAVGSAIHTERLLRISGGAAP